VKKCSSSCLSSLSWRKKTRFFVRNYPGNLLSLTPQRQRRRDRPTEASCLTGGVGVFSAGGRNTGVLTLLTRAEQKREKKKGLSARAKCVTKEPKNCKRR
jgi:hypothetical protein